MRTPQTLETLLISMRCIDDQHSHLLTPSFALSGILQDPPAYEKMTPEEIFAFLTEMEPDIRAADRDMLEIDTLEKKGILGAGKLPGNYFFFFFRFGVYTYTCFFFPQNMRNSNLGFKQCLKLMRRMFSSPLLWKLG